LEDVELRMQFEPISVQDFVCGYQLLLHFS